VDLQQQDAASAERAQESLRRALKVRNIIVGYSALSELHGRYV
jgi:hypothetical protein